MKKDILFLCQFFYPEHNSSATLPSDTARYFAKQGFKVGVLCGYPKEYFDGNEVPYEENIDGVSIHRIPYVQSSRAGKLGRLINYFSFTAGAILSTKILRDYRCIICYSNPPILPVAALRAVKRFGSKLVLVVYDAYPEIAYASDSIKKNSAIDKIMRRINHKMYQIVDTVIVISEEMRDFILSNRPELTGKRVVVIHNWAHEENDEGADTANVHPEECRVNQAAESDDDFRVSYIGNMGICQDMDTLVETAERTVSNPHIEFKLIGHGNKKEKIEQYISRQGLNNVRIKEYMTGTALRRELEDSSCCVVSLTEGLKGMCAPSKYYTYLFAGKPVISVMETNSYISREIVQEEIGFAIENGDSAGFEKAISRLAEEPDLVRAMGERAGALYRRKYRYDIAMGKYRDVIVRVLENSD